MIFSRNLPLLLAARKVLHAMKPASQEGLLVLDGLDHITHSVDRFDAAIASGHAFTKHFLQALTSPALDDQGCWMELFEDIALLVREKTLRPPHEGIAPVEHRILHHFETCGEWSPHDGTQVSAWYWHQLPRLVGRGMPAPGEGDKDPACDAEKRLDDRPGLT